MTRRIDLNCDMGEAFGAWTMGDDLAMLDVVTSANIACGFHAGDPSVMLATVTAAVKRGVTIGAHPGFADLQGVGRRRIVGLSSSELEALIAYQTGALMGIAAMVGAHVTYVKAHGALGNMACEDATIAAALASAIRAVDRGLVFVVMPGTELERAGQRLGLPMAREIFADRAYNDDLTLVSRSRPGAVLHDPRLIAARAVRMINESVIVTASGKSIPARADTICVHGDTPSAVDIARSLRTAFEADGIKVTAFASPSPTEPA